jgi:hypothetical protein
METERIALSQRERDRLRMSQEVQQGQLTEVELAARVKLSDRSGASAAAAHTGAKRPGGGPLITRTAIEPQISGPIRAEDSGAGSPALY